MPLTEAMLCRGCGGRIRGRTDKEWCSDRCRKRESRRETGATGSGMTGGTVVEELTELVAETEQVAGLNVSEGPIIEGANGMRAQNVTCSTHDTAYTRIQIPNLGWTGQCPECAADQRLEIRAQELLSTRRTQVHGRLQNELERREPEIQQEVEREVERYAQEVRPQIEAYVRSQISDQILSQLEGLAKAEIIAELRAQGA